MKILAGLCALALFTTAVPAFADSHHGGGGNGYRGSAFGHHGGYDHHRGGGHYYYFGGVPYFYPYSSFGFGDPYWYGGYGYSAFGGYPDAFDDRYYGDRPYQGRIVDETAPGRQIRGARSLPGAVQRQLAEKGYYKGGIDGVFGPGSKSALKRYQHDKGLKQSGLIDEPTLKALGFGER